MKKLLLTAAVAVSAIAVNAQALHSVPQMQKAMAEKPLNATDATAFVSSKAKAPKKAVADGCYYVRPEGSYTYGFNKEGMGYYNAWTIVAPYTPFEFNNMSTKKESTSWNWAALNDPSYITEFVNDDNNFAFEMDPASGYVMPTITTGKVDYTWGQTDNTYGDNYQSVMRAEDVVGPLTMTDPHLGPDYIGWGFLSSHYLFGDGSIEEGGATYQCFAIEQAFPKPMSPLYVEDIYMRLLNLNKKYFLQGDETLYLDIVNADDEVIYTLTAGVDDVTLDDDGESFEVDYGDMRSAQAVFSMKDVDPLTGDVAAVPFVLDEAFKVRIYGFEGKNIGFCGHFMMADKMPTAEASVVENGYLIFYNVADEGDMVKFTFQNNIAIPMTFSAFFDKAQVWTSAVTKDGDELTDFNVLNISADGQTVMNAGYPDANFVNVNTASSWLDEDDNEMYYLADVNDEFPEWLNYGIDNSGWTDYNPETENPKPTVYVLFQAEPLPEGVTGRGVKLYVNGRGIVSEDPIYVLQGDITKEEVDSQAAGVNSVLAPKTFNGKTYNVAGQQVNKNFNGIVVKDGKKFINK